MLRFFLTHLFEAGLGQGGGSRASSLSLRQLRPALLGVPFVRLVDLAAVLLQGLHALLHELHVGAHIVRSDRLHQILHRGKPSRHRRSWRSGVAVDRVWVGVWVGGVSGWCEWVAGTWRVGGARSFEARSFECVPGRTLALDHFFLPSGVFFFEHCFDLGLGEAGRGRAE